MTTAQGQPLSADVLLDVEGSGGHGLRHRHAAQQARTHHTKVVHGNIVNFLVWQALLV